MNSSRVIVAFALALILQAACSSNGRPPLPSPDGSFALHTSIERSRSDPTAYGCVIVEVRDKSGKVLHRENSHASAFQRWDVRWTSNEEFTLTSSDIGTYMWKRQSDATWTKQ